MILMAEIMTNLVAFSAILVPIIVELPIYYGSVFL